MANVVNCDNDVGEFEIQSHYNVLFLINTLRKGVNPLVHGLVGRVFANGPGNLGSTPGRVIPKTLKMVLDTSLLNSQQYKVRIKGKVE